MDVYFDEETEKEGYIETVREAKTFTLDEVLSSEVDEHNNFITQPELWKHVIENAKLCNAPEVPTSKIIEALGNIDRYIEQYEESFKAFQESTQSLQASILCVLKDFQNHNARSKPQYAMTLDKVFLGIKDGVVRMSVKTEICKPKVDPVVNHFVEQVEGE